MSLRQTRILLWTIAAAWFIASVSGLVLGWLLPYRLPSVREPAIHPTQDDRAVPVSTGLELASFKPIWQLGLRRPLYDPQPVQVVKEAFVPPPFAARLTGTVIQPSSESSTSTPGASDSVAMFVTSQGKMELRTPGEEIAGGQVLQVEQGQVTVRYYDQNLVLTIEKGR